MNKISLLAPLASLTLIAGCSQPAGVTGSSKAQLLLENSYEFLNPEHGMVDSVSGYPVEGWNHDPERGLYLRSFTQLTAIGEWIELLGNIAAGEAENPHISSEDALSGLEKAVDSLLKDQADASLSAKGLLSNFLGLRHDGRAGPLRERVKKTDITSAFEGELGTNIWNDLVEAEWLEPGKMDDAAVRRSPTYGGKHFEGVLEKYNNPEQIESIMKILDGHVVNIIFGDNVNLTASAAKTIGALLHPSLKDNSRAAELRTKMETFIENQREGYHHMYDDEVGSFVFGWIVSEDCFFGWDDGKGNWIVGRMNYFINEFRGAWIFTTLRYDIPMRSVDSGSFKLKPYRTSDGQTIYAAAAWDGSAFQMLGLSLFMNEMNTPGWQQILQNTTAVELDYAARNKLSGFLSESYSGNGTEYTGAVAIPDLAVTKEHRITTAPSLYTLGIAHSIDSEGVEQLLEREWPTVSGLFTDHGPWEGYNTTNSAPIELQTSAHTLSLILGFIDKGHENMARYLDHAGLSRKLDDFYSRGPALDLFADTFDAFAWGAAGNLKTSRDDTCFSLSGSGIKDGQIAVKRKDAEPFDLSGHTLKIRYTAKKPAPGCVLTISPVSVPAAAMPNEIYIDFEATGSGSKELSIPLPAVPILKSTKELILGIGDRDSLDLKIESLSL